MKINIITLMPKGGFPPALISAITMASCHSQDSLTATDTITSNILAHIKWLAKTLQPMLLQYLRLNGVFHFNWRTSSINSRLLCSLCKLCFIRTFSCSKIFTNGPCNRVHNQYVTSHSLQNI